MKILLNCHFLITNYDTLCLHLIELNNLLKCCYSHFIHESTVQGVFKKLLMNENGEKDFSSGMQNTWI